MVTRAPSDPHSDVRGIWELHSPKLVVTIVLLIMSRMIQILYLVMLHAIKMNGGNHDRTLPGPFRHLFPPLKIIYDN